MSERIFSFPNPVNEVSARLVAGGVVLMALSTIVFDVPWLSLVIAYGFIARAAAGPRFSPLGLFVTKVLTPALPFKEKLVPGPPKRFAQAVGVVFSVSAAILAVGLGLTSAGYVVLGVLAVFATLESVFGVCVGCIVFGLLMRFGVIPEEVCERCSNIGLAVGPSGGTA
ncbi:MAG: DUF4395 family protein [Actinobacteria bacterium]|uniref:Unannotated protein n=1 Tax=freshwater metagenome TaxID=449393 RepID=A0A6J5ZEK0_9ZZZZ|nr:DUF4395 family protein [Actinomycetota bacterium]